MGDSLGSAETQAADSRPSGELAPGPAPGDSEFSVVEPARYTDRVELTHGGMGRIVVARDQRLRRPVALKELRADSPERRARFEREAMLTARLQHPGIVSIHEAGRWPSGEPFYAMKLVRGRSLDQVIGAAATLEARLALLPHVIAVADALAYAHHERVIHRDLKPSNVMVGEFGETVVIDWGLAKHLDAADVDAAPAARADAATSIETVIGAVLGTPSFMPPEQAEGRPVDERADVYAIGAILYDLLAGAPPYAGKTGHETLEAVRRGPPRDLAETQPGVPRDLLAVVSRAMARDPGARYPTARELAEDLRRFQTGQLVGAHRYSTWQRVKRWLARNRRTVGVAGVAALVLLVVSVAGLRGIVVERRRAEQERAVAQRERAVAEQHRAELEDLLGFMLFDLHRKLEPIGRLELLDAVAVKANDYYARRPPSEDIDEERRRAVALRNVGDVRLAKGNADAARDAYRASLAIVEALVAVHPGHAGIEGDIAKSHEKLGDFFLLAVGDPTASLAAYRASLFVRERLLAARPDAAELLRDLSVSHDGVGNSLWLQEDAAGALTAYRASLAVAEKLTVLQPDRPGLQRDLAISHGNVGRALLAANDAGGALAALRASLAIAEKLVALDGTNTEWRRDLSLAHSKVGDVLLAQGDPAGALAAYRASLAARATLAAMDRDNGSWQRDLLVGHQGVGDVLLERGDTAAALAEYRAALAIAEALVARDQSNSGWLRDLAYCHVKVGSALAARGDAAGARTATRAGLAAAEKLVAIDPNNTESQRAVAVCHENIGDVLLVVRDTVGARDAYAAAAAVYATLATTEAGNPVWSTETTRLRERIAACCAPPRPQPRRGP